MYFHLLKFTTLPLFPHSGTINALGGHLYQALGMPFMGLWASWASWASRNALWIRGRSSYTRLFLGGRHPLCGIGVTSRI